MIEQFNKSLSSMFLKLVNAFKLEIPSHFVAKCPRGSTSIEKNPSAHIIEPGQKTEVLVHSYKCSD